MSNYNPTLHPPEDEPSVGSNPDQISYSYRIAATIPDSLQKTIESTLESTNLSEKAVQGVFEWHPPFRTDNINEIMTSLEAWVQEHLPIETETEKVHSEVVEEQIYIAGWKLANASSIIQAQNDLTVLLAEIVRTDELPPFQAMLPVLTSIPANRFPHVVGYLQQHFKSTVWKIEAIDLFRIPLDEAGNIPIDIKWELVKQFRHA